MPGNGKHTSHSALLKTYSSLSQTRETLRFMNRNIPVFVDVSGGEYTSNSLALEEFLPFLSELSGVGTAAANYCARPRLVW
jgi:hypothetical protein